MITTPCGSGRQLSLMNLTVNGDVSANSELNVSSNLKVLGTADFEKDLLVKGGLVEVNDTPQ